MGTRCREVGARSRTSPSDDCDDKDDDDDKVENDDGNIPGQILNVSSCRRKMVLLVVVTLLYG